MFSRHKLVSLFVLLNTFFFWCNAHDITPFWLKCLYKLLFTAAYFIHTSNPTTQPRLFQKTSKLTTREPLTSILYTRESLTSKSYTHDRNSPFRLVPTEQYFRYFHTWDFSLKPRKSLIYWAFHIPTYQPSTSMSRTQHDILRLLYMLAYSKVITCFHAIFHLSCQVSISTFD